MEQTGLHRQREREQVVGIPKLAGQPAFLKTYPGVNIELGGNAVIEKTVENALDIVKEQGYDIPPTIKIDTDFFVKGNAGKDAICAYMQNVIYINDRHEIWNDPLGYIKARYKDRYLSTDRSEAVLWHEIGHYLHAKANPAEYMKMITGSFADAGEAAIAKLVSDYAAENPVEFVAEVFAARLAGMDQDFPIEVFLLFQKYGGGI